MQRADRSIVMLLCLVALSSCSVERNWRPEGSVEVVDHYQSEGFAGNLVVVTYRIANSPDAVVAILATTFTLGIESDLRTYFRTVVDASFVRAGHSVYGTCELLLEEAEELVTGVTLVDSFFE